MFDILFGWRKASKCKKLIRRVQCRLKLLKNKRCSIVRQLRDDVAQLLRNGHDQIAFNRVEQLFKDESILAVYDLLEHFCEFIIIHLSYIRRQKDCPNDINEAISTLIFASARCGDLPELRNIRKLFGERYGQRFATTALELLPGNLVNSQIKENLSIKSVSDDVKYRLVDEIARTCFQQGPLALEYCSELHQQQAMKESEDRIQNSDDQTNHGKIEGCQMQVSKVSESEEKIVYISFLFNDKKLLTEQRLSHQIRNSLPDTEDFSMHKKEGKVDKFPQLNDPSEFTIPETLKPEELKMTIESSSESSPQLPEERIYLDDIEEFQSPVRKDGNCQDQRVFIFKASVLPQNEKFQDGSENKGTRNSRKSGKVGGKRLRRKSISREGSCVNDVEYAIYCGESCENSPKHSRKYYNKKIAVDESIKSYAQERVEKCCSKKIGSSFGSEMVKECSLEHPFYLCANDEKEESAISSCKQMREIASSEGLRAYDVKEKELKHGICRCCCSCRREATNQEMGFSVLPQKPIRSHLNGEKLSENSTCPVHMLNKQSMKVQEPEGSNSLCGRASICSCSSASSQWTIDETQPPYLRAMTMPPERPKETWNENILRSNSFPFQQPNDLKCSSPHVHPKLPDYDELAAKFRALKNANLQNKYH